MLARVGDKPLCFYCCMVSAAHALDSQHLDSSDVGWRVLMRLCRTLLYDLDGAGIPSEVTADLQREFRGHVAYNHRYCHHEPAIVDKPLDEQAPPW